MRTSYRLVLLPVALIFVAWFTSHSSYAAKVNIKKCYQISSQNKVTELLGKKFVKPTEVVCLNIWNDSSGLYPKDQLRGEVKFLSGKNVVAGGIGEVAQGRCNNCYKVAQSSTFVLTRASWVSAIGNGQSLSYYFKEDRELTITETSQGRQEDRVYDLKLLE